MEPVEWKAVRKMPQKARNADYTKEYNQKAVLRHLRRQAMSRAELARALNSLLGRCPDGQDAQLQAAAWYRDNQDQTAWYYADLIEASADHTCRFLPQGEQWTAIG